MSASGDWKKSKLYIQATESRSNKKMGKRKWFLKSEMISRFGVAAREEMIQRKEGDMDLKETECRDHPDCPGVEARALEWVCFW